MKPISASEMLREFSLKSCEKDLAPDIRDEEDVNGRFIMGQIYYCQIGGVYLSRIRKKSLLIFLTVNKCPLRPISLYCLKTILSFIPMNK